MNRREKLYFFPRTVLKYRNPTNMRFCRHKIIKMSAPTLEPVSVPLHGDASGAFRIADTRVLLELIVRAFHAGATPEEIVQAYDTLKLRDVYSLLAWCLNNESFVADYMADREQQASAVQKELNALRPGGADLLKSLRNRAAGAGV